MAHAGLSPTENVFVLAALGMSHKAISLLPSKLRGQTAYARMTQLDREDSCSAQRFHMRKACLSVGRLSEKELQATRSSIFKTST